MYNKFKALEGIIGNTPMIEINFEYKGEIKVIYAKLESFNMTGSIKDRIALYILKNAYEKGDLKANDKIVEATSGNTGISFAAIGKALGYKVCVFIPDWMSEERKNLIKAFGAEVILVSKEQGGFLGSIKMTEEFSRKEENVFLPCQFSNEDNVKAHYNTTGPEIWNQLNSAGLKPDALVAGVGTGGTVMGIGRYLKERNKEIRIYPLEPSNSPILSTGEKNGSHRIQGISDEFIPAIMDLEKLDHVISVDDGDAIIMAQKLASELGLGVGISSGANFLGALKAQNELGSNAVVVTIFADDNKKYLTTDLLKDEPVKDGFMSTDVKLISLKVLG
ncbi:PLP-dependent cysteine synthase family protein [Clostridium sp.]|uniref:PLP-dependent cysteine synthase family protein n=1 Tax=Clostridium sp. TaxID=1506 RepID=UPI003216656C